MLGKLVIFLPIKNQVGGQAVLGRQSAYATPWLTERHGYDPTSLRNLGVVLFRQKPQHYKRQQAKKRPF